MIEFKVIPNSITMTTSIPFESNAPKEVIDEYVNSCNESVAIWKYSEMDLCGCIHNNRSVKAVLSHAHKVVVYEVKPAKGSGWVGITLQNDSDKELVTLFGLRYSQSSINWLNRTQEEVGEFLGLKTEFQDLGYDV